MKPSGFITLLTDFGLRDPYVAMMKGVILSINPAACIVDITHQIGTGAVAHAAGLLKETFPYFPNGTVHVAVVDPGVGSGRRLMALQAADHFFVGPDNGVFWPVIEAYGAARVIHLVEERYFLPRVTCTFHGREIFAPVAAHLSLGVDPGVMGPALLHPVPIQVPRSYEKEGVLHGEIIRVDNFGNLITNIGRKDMEDFLQTGSALIEVGRLSIGKLSRIYADAEEGQPLALINSSDLLEIAVNMGRASDYAGIDQQEIQGTLVKVQRNA